MSGERVNLQFPYLPCAALLVFGHGAAFPTLTQPDPMLSQLQVVTRRTVVNAHAPIHDASWRQPAAFSLAWSFAQLSRRPMVRTKTSRSGFDAGSRQK